MVDTDDDVIWAARYGDLEEIQKYAEEGLNINATDANGNTAVHMAAANGHTDVLAFLLPRCRQDIINVQNNGGNTALHWAALNGHVNAVKKLLEFGADPQVKNKSHRTPFDDAVQGHHDEACVAIVQSPKYKTEEDGPEPPPNAGIESEVDHNQL